MAARGDGVFSCRPYQSGNAMSLDLRVDVADDILVITTSGVLGNLDQHLDYVRAVHAEVVRLGKTRLLLDERALQYNLKTAEVFKLGENVAGTVEPAMRIAVVTEARKGSRFEFFEDVVRNRGLRYKVFLSREDAEAWLMS